jgi:hypothetical protein
MSIINEANITMLEGEDITYESQYGICIESGIGKPVYLMISNMRILTFVDESLKNPVTYLLCSILPFSAIWLKKKWVVKDTCSTEELKSIERYKNGMNDKLIKFNKLNGQSFILGLGDKPSFERLYSFVETMITKCGKNLQEEGQNKWIIV